MTPKPGPVTTTYKKFIISFNRAAAQHGQKEVWNVRTAGRCLQVTEVLCLVPVKTRFRPKGRQPREVLIGKGRMLIDTDGAAVIYAGQPKHAF